MPERPINPAPRKPIREARTPNHRDAFYTELVNRDDPMYRQNVPFKRGTFYSSLLGAKQEVINLYPSLRFVLETKPGNLTDFGSSADWAILVFSTAPTAESTYNADISYLAENVSYPAFARSYIIPRATWEANQTIATGTPLKALIAIKVTNGGTGYSTATIGIAGTGTGATAESVISGGVIQEIIVTNEGINYTAAPTITITGDGTGATATGIIQPQTAVLVSQKKSELPEDSLLRNEFVSVLRVYRAIYGPVLQGAEQSTFGILGTLAVQDVATGDPADTGINIASSRVTPKDSIIASKETLTVPFSSTTVSFKVFDDRGYEGDVTRTWLAPDASLPTQSNLIHVERQIETKDRARQEVMTFANSRPLVTKSPSRYGGYDVATDTLVAPSTTPNNTGATVERLIQEKEKEARLISIVIATGNTVTERRQYDEQILEAYFDVEYSLVLATDAIPANTATIIYERHIFDENSKLRVLIKKTYNVPSGSYTDYPEQGIVRPALFTSFYIDDFQGATRISREGYSEHAPHRRIRTFSLTAAPVSRFLILENNLLGFSISIQGLMDAGTFTRTTRDGVTYTQPYPASIPSKSTYDALVVGGAYHVVGGSCNIKIAKIYEIVTLEAIFI